MDRMTAVYDIAALREKYDNYFLPVARITVGDKVIAIGGEKKSATASFLVESVQVSLSMDSASSASFTVADIYDLEKSRVKKAVKDTFACGMAVKVELGYGSEYEDVFHGVVYETSTQFSDVPSLQVTAMDVKRLMADNWRLGYTWEKGTVSEIFGKVIQSYSALGITACVEGEKGSEVIEKYTQRGSDLGLVRKFCRDYSMRFVVYGDRAKLFGEANQKPMLTLAWGRDLLSFTYGESYVNVCVEVRGTYRDLHGSEVRREPVCGKGAEKSGLQATKRVVELTNIESSSEVDDRMAEELESIRESMYTGSRSCMGMPVLLPGRYIKIDKLDDGIDGVYLLKAVTHSFGGEGFTTSFTLGGKKP